ncbi:MAG: hypothetical protein JWM80_799 [Cyanobacteria bacterium RYN_339]|nr:hypothetical protein [Cyanobacteria bacterium RYN_339]
MRRLALSLLLLAVAGCGRAPLATPAAPNAAQILARDPVQAMRPLVETLMDRCFELMTVGYGNPKATIDADDLTKYLDLTAPQAATLLAAIDKDGDKQASQAELMDWGVAHEGLVRMNDVFVAPTFKHADKDGDHKLRFDEAAAAALALGDHTWDMKIAKPEFSAFDLNHDALLAESEFDKLATTKVSAGLKADKELPGRVAQIFFKTIPWSH